jgi:hypothetical protein
VAEKGSSGDGVMSDPTWTILLERGVVQGEYPAVVGTDSPWYIKTLLGCCGWLAALFIVGFIGTAFQVVFDTPIIAGVVGAMLAAGAFVLLRLDANEFVEHLGLATSVAGQGLMIFCIFELIDHGGGVAWLLVAMLQAALAVLMPNFVHRVVSTLLAALAVAMACNELHIPYGIGGIVMFGASWCWLNEFRYPRRIKTVHAIGYGLTVALVALKATSIFGYGTPGRLFSQEHHFYTQPWLGELVIGAVTLFVVYRILRSYHVPLNGRLSMTAMLTALLICAVSMTVQGVTVGMVIVSLGFFRANRVLLGLGIVSLLFYTSSYYYLLDTTLLAKSQSLLVVGLTLLAVRWGVCTMFPVKNNARES